MSWSAAPDCLPRPGIFHGLEAGGEGRGGGNVRHCPVIPLAGSSRVHLPVLLTGLDCTANVSHMEKRKDGQRKEKREEDLMIMK